MGHRYTEIRSFLGGECDNCVDLFKNVKVEWKLQQEPILKLFNDQDEEIGELDLKNYNSIDELNNLLTRLGFARRNPQELQEYRVEKSRIQQQEDLLELERQKASAKEWKQRQELGELMRQREAAEMRKLLAQKEGNDMMKEL